MVQLDDYCHNNIQGNGDAMACYKNYFIPQRAPLSLSTFFLQSLSTPLFCRLLNILAPLSPGEGRIHYAAMKKVSIVFVGLAAACQAADTITPDKVEAGINLEGLVFGLFISSPAPRLSLFPDG